MNKNFADISAFEALANSSAGSSMSAFQTKTNVAVQNVDISLKVLADLAGDDDLSSLVNFLEVKGRLNFADNTFRGKSMSSVDELKRVILHGIGCSSMESFHGMYDGELAPEAPPEVSPEVVKDAAVPEKKLGWWGRRRERNKLVDEGRELYQELERIRKRTKGTKEDPFVNASDAQKERVSYIYKRITELEQMYNDLNRK